MSADAPDIAVVVADDDARFRQLLRAVIGSEPALRLLGEAADAEEAIALAARLQPDVVLIDVTMPGGGGARAAREIIARSPASRVLALSGSGDRDAVMAMLRAGAIGYLVKGTPNARLVDAIQRAARGEGELSREVTTDVVRELGGHLAREDREERTRGEQLERVRRVLRDGVVRMAFQPIVNLETGERRGVEALARFPVEPVRGPDRWFAEAACVGLLVPLELAAVRAALAVLRRLPRGVYLTLNVSPETVLHPGFAATLAPHAGAPITLEITEHAPVEDYDAMTAALAGPRAQGLRLAIDDAGAGFASLRHILRLAPDAIKVDMTLTRGIETDRPKRALTRALISFASETGATVVAEGIETASEAAALRALGVRFGQGYHVGRPGPLDDIL